HLDMSILTDPLLYRFLNQGMNIRNILYNYVPTYTGPGHASIYTGSIPADHGIVGNEWYDRKTSSVINCVTDTRESTIGSISTDGQRSPRNLKTYTITDQLKLTYPSARVISISYKDRSAILPGGHLSDGSYWFDYATGTFITSSFFKKELPLWLKQFNAKNNAKSYTKNWDLLLSKDCYTSIDKSPYELIIGGKTSAEFPYNFLEMGNEASANQLFTISPFANTLLTDLALESLKNEKLGEDLQTDMLCISYSTPDIAGHAFGPYSLEIEDMYLRLDLEISRLLGALSAKCGKDGFTVFLTADHAVVPVPQMLIDKKLPGGYLFLDTKLSELAKKSIEKFGENLIEKEENQNIYLNKTKIKSLNLELEVISNFIADEIRTWEAVKAVFTSKQLLDGNTSNNTWKTMMENGYDFERSGEIIFILDPGYLLKSSDIPSAHKGTSHGSSFNYDTHVPLLWYGKNITKGDVFTPYQIIDIAPTLSHLLNLQQTGAMTGIPIQEIFRK
ncbi:MAG: alkaline phosphatase family protein, partial [Crocinitomicaceae bacterium]|nr:alkaline phosphatase family protein [Crocinitomicaceae bacterium]